MAKQVESRDAVMARYRGYGDDIVLHRGDGLVVHRCGDGRVVVIEHEVHGVPSAVVRPTRTDSSRSCPSRIEKSCTAGLGRVRRLRGQLEWQPARPLFLLAVGGYQQVDASLERFFLGEQDMVEYLEQAERALRDRVASRFRDVGRNASRVAGANRSLEEGQPAIEKGRLWAADVSAHAIVTEQLSTSCAIG